MNLEVIHPSGYADDVTAKQDVSDQRISFLQKPLSAQHLMAKIREVFND